MGLCICLVRALLCPNMEPLSRVALTERYFSLQEKAGHSVAISKVGDGKSTHLACGSNTLPDAEKTDKPD